MGTSGAVASRYLICHLACVSSDSGLRRFWTHSGVCVRLWPSSNPHELGFAAASSSPEIHGGVQHSAEWASPRCDSKRPAELCLTDRPGCRHSVPDHSHCSACKWKRKSHVCEGMHQRGYIFSLMVLYLWGNVSVSLVLGSCFSCWLTVLLLTEAFCDSSFQPVSASFDQVVHIFLLQQLCLPWWTFSWPQVSIKICR